MVSPGRRACRDLRPTVPEAALPRAAADRIGGGARRIPRRPPDRRQARRKDFRRSAETTCLQDLSRPRSSARNNLSPPTAVISATSNPTTVLSMSMVMPPLAAVPRRLSVSRDVWINEYRPVGPVVQVPLGGHLRRFIYSSLCISAGCTGHFKSPVIVSSTGNPANIRRIRREGTWNLRARHRLPRPCWLGPRQPAIGPPDAAGLAGSGCGGGHSAVRYRLARI